MSISVMNAAWLTDVPTGELVVLLALADHANERGGCWPPIEKLCRKTRKCKRSLQEALRRLERAGHISRREVPGRGILYTVHPVAKTATGAADFATGAETDRGGNDCCEPVAQIAPKPTVTTNKDTAKAVSTVRAKAGDGFHPLPPDWAPTRPLSQSCAEKVAQWPPGAFDDQLESFRAWALNADPKKGKGLKKDWHHAWENWIRNANHEYHRRRPAGWANQSRSSEAFAAITAGKPFRATFLSEAGEP